MWDDWEHLDFGEASGIRAAAHVLRTETPFEQQIAALLQRSAPD
jgi:hypothetical protein